MSKRESGWYRVKADQGGEFEMARYSCEKCTWSVISCDLDFSDDGLFEIDPKMVMTPSGELVYHQPTDRALAAVERYKNPDSWNVNEHDPLYNTQQEG